MSKYKLIIFETNKKDGCMSLAPKFYPENYSLEERKKVLQSVKNKVGKKYQFDGNHIFQPYQKDVEKDVDYPDGKYIKISEKDLVKEDYWDEKLPCDILMIDTEYPNIVIGHRMADCPVIIAEDIKKQVVAVSHCGASQINREVPRLTIEALKKEKNSNSEDIHVYIGSCIKKENYKYDRYPLWATNKKVWENKITLRDGIYYIDLISAIKKQLKDENIPLENITESPYDTLLSDDYYSHTEAHNNPDYQQGQNFVGCFYQKISES